MTERIELREEFYRQRDRRTISFGASAAALESTVGLSVAGETANCRAGQVAVLALVNMIARAHRTLAIEIPSTAPLIAHCPFASKGSLADALVATISAIDPFARLEFRRPTSNEPSIAVGRTNGSICISTNGATAFTASQPGHLVGDSGAAMLGAALASCLGAAELFKVVHSGRLRSTAISIWDWIPTDRRSGPDHLPSLDVGSVVLVGGGAVASGLAYWVSEFGHSGDWAVVDGDVVKLHNTNRSLIFSAADAGWPTGVARMKAPVVADVLNARSICTWYDDWVRAEPEAAPDLIIPLANERGVREAISQRGLPVVLHATTSRAWQAQFHRHIAASDECLACRFPPENAPVFECAQAPERPDRAASTDQESDDAALPFLSAGAGLLLLVGLLRLADGSLANLPENFWWLSFHGSARAIRAARGMCGANCESPPRDLVRILSRGSRWAYLVG